MNTTQREGEWIPRDKAAWIAVSCACMMDALLLRRRMYGWPWWVNAADERPPATEPSVKKMLSRGWMMFAISTMVRSYSIM